MCLRERDCNFSQDGNCNDIEFGDENTNGIVNDYHIELEDPDVFNESNVYAKDKFNCEDDKEDDVSDDDDINAEIFMNSSKLYSTMKLRVQTQEDMSNLVEDRNNHHELSETVMSLIDFLFPLTKHK